MWSQKGNRFCVPFLSVHILICYLYFGEYDFYISELIFPSFNALVTKLTEIKRFIGTILVDVGNCFFLCFVFTVFFGYVSKQNLY